jgi:transposase
MSVGRKPGLRLVTAERRGQLSWEMMRLDDCLPEEHRAREVWDYVAGLDLSRLYDAIASVEGGAGRPALDPAMLMSLWLYAVLEGIGSARQLAQLCERDIVYRWIMGGEPVSHKTLSDFRVKAGPVLDDLLSRSVAALAAADVIDLESLAVDGMRLRASAGSNSFRSKERLAELDRLAREKVAKLRQELESDPGASDRRTRARRQRAVDERKRKIEAAQQAEAEIEAQRAEEAAEQRRKQPANKRPPRASTTDADARIMKMADGGFRPAYNVRLVSDVESQLVVGVSVGSNGSDRGQLGPAVSEIEERYGQRPRELLADGGFDAKTDIEALHASDKGAVAAFCPWPRTTDRQPRPLTDKDGPGVRAWHERMVSEEGKKRYGQRFATERPHADMRNRGLTRVLVRGMERVKSVVLWYVHAHNFLTISRLRRPA